ncbi:polygalacturonase QRT2-like [Rutidosis leptorrhynchoides]|uniref:polygalacturonase QRT2-like n=1 Tax=Rutidosis leptorrhynchoides TaxID=125765 RepID=UPI003A999E72
MHLQKHLLIILTILVSTLSCSSYKNHNQHLQPTRILLAKHRSEPHHVNVDHYGAMANGTDDSKAFMEAWMHACNSSATTEFVVPKHKVYHLKPITFSGPCKSVFKVKIRGTIKASTRPSVYVEDRRHWIIFENLENLRVDGGGTINGNGKIWWVKSCKVDETQPCLGAPTALTFRNCTNLIVKRIRFKNPQQVHLTFQNSLNVRASHLRMIAPATSPNTDGVHITGSQNVRVVKSVFRTGDDCVSIVNGSTNVVIKNVKCGPGHGISIGSLGKNNSDDTVSNILVDKAIISNTENGVRIKSWQGGSGYARNIKFQNIIMHNVSNPIIINQNYCDSRLPCPEQYSGVQMQDVVYKNIRGTSNSEVAINFNCSKTFPCQSILLDNVVLNRVKGDEGEINASCSNVMLDTKVKVTPRCE